MRIRTKALAALAAIAALGATAGAAQAAAPTGNFVGNAYGSYANVDNLVVAAPTALLGFGCLTPPNSKGSRTIASVNLPGLLQLGAIDTGAVTTETATTLGDATSASIGDVNLLGGAIVAHAIRASSGTQADATGIHVSSNGTELVGLAIGGKPLPINPGPNTKISLPGIGTVTLNEQIPIADGTTVGLIVNAIDINVTIGRPGLAVGTRIILGHAESGLALTSAGINDEVIGGFSYASSIAIAHIITSSPTFPAVLNIGLGCGSVLHGAFTDTGVGVNIPGLITSGTLTQTSSGKLGATSATGDTTSSIEHLSILGGLISANVIKAESNATATPTSSSFNQDGSQLVGLTVGGKSIPINVGPNFHISIAGLTVWVDRVIKTSKSLEVRMLEVTGISNKSPVNGSLIDIRVAVAQTQT